MTTDFLVKAEVMVKEPPEGNSMAAPKIST
jgi:hypothetical protein